MAEQRLRISIDGQEVRVVEGTSVAAAVWNHGIAGFRTSVAGAPRAPLCGMGICFECRLTIDGRIQERSCLLPCREGMVVHSAEGDPLEGGRRA